MKEQLETMVIIAKERECWWMEDLQNLVTDAIETDHTCYFKAGSCQSCCLELEIEAYGHDNLYD